MRVLYVSTTLEIYDNDGKDDGKLLRLGFPDSGIHFQPLKRLRPFYKLDKAYMSWIFGMIALLMKRVESGAAPQAQLEKMMKRLTGIIEYARE